MHGRRVQLRGPAELRTSLGRPDVGGTIYPLPLATFCNEEDAVSEERRRAQWTDPRYSEAVTLLDTCRTVTGPSRRVRRVCPHGSGVTIIIDPVGGHPRNVACADC